MPTLKEYMEEKRLISRGMILVVGLTSAFAGALLMLIFALLGLVS